MAEETKQTLPTETPAQETTSAVDVLHFDPFKTGDDIPEVKTTGTADKTNSVGEGDETTPTPSPTPSPAPTTKPVEAANPSSEQARHWQEIAEAREAELRTFRKPEAETDKGGLKVPSYDFTIPDQLIDLLTSEDVNKFKGGVVALAKGIAGAIHAQMYTQFEEAYKPKFESIPGLIQRFVETRQASNEIEKDFYGKYKELDHPHIRTLVQQTGTAVAKELNKTAWDAELRDETAKRVKEILKVATGQVSNGRDRTPPPRMLPGQGSRPNVNAKDDVATEIADLLFNPD